MKKISKLLYFLCYKNLYPICQNGIDDKVISFKYLNFCLSFKKNMNNTDMNKSSKLFLNMIKKYLKT
jgi:hypothetical protein